MNYQELDNQLQGRTRLQRKYANNTYLVRRDDYLALLYHSTEVVKHYPNGNVVLDNGGWYTSTTKERINWGLPEGYMLSQDKGVWYLCTRYAKEVYKYQNSITITPLGVEGYAKDNPKADRQLKNKVKAYAQLCADSVPLAKPSEGDCWYCAMTTQNGASLGDAIGANIKIPHHTTHLDSHIEESYIVPSLVFRALKEYGNTDFILSLVFNNPEGSMLDIARERVKKSVYRYILRRKGYAV